MFFQNFPNTFFDLDKTNRVIVTDFIRAIKIDPRLKDNDLFYTFYEAQDGEMPEVISHKVYGTTMYHWVIMAINEKFDPFNDFPKSDATLLKYAAEKSGDVNEIHHLDDENGNWVDAFTVGGIPITNIEYERKENEKKRTVKILKRDVLEEFVSQYEELIRI